MQQLSETRERIAKLQTASQSDMQEATKQDTDRNEAGVEAPHAASDTVKGDNGLRQRRQEMLKPEV